jgi:hypothetical protein
MLFFEAKTRTTSMKGGKKDNGGTNREVLSDTESVQLLLDDRLEYLGLFFFCLFFIGGWEREREGELFCVISCFGELDMFR